MTTNRFFSFYLVNLNTYNIPIIGPALLSWPVQAIEYLKSLTNPKEKFCPHFCWPCFKNLFGYSNLTRTRSDYWFILLFGIIALVLTFGDNRESITVTSLCSLFFFTFFTVPFNVDLGRKSVDLWPVHFVSNARAIDANRTGCCLNQLFDRNPFWAKNFIFNLIYELFLFNFPFSLESSMFQHTDLNPECRTLPKLWFSSHVCSKRYFMIYIMFVMLRLICTRFIVMQTISQFLKIISVFVFKFNSYFIIIISISWTINSEKQKTYEMQIVFRLSTLSFKTHYLIELVYSIDRMNVTKSFHFKFHSLWASLFIVELLDLV